MKVSIHLLTLLAAALLFSSCKHNFTGSDHISPKVMQKILMDINLAEAYSIMKTDSLHRPGTKNADSLAVYYKDIFAHYHITETEFEQSLNWYKANPDDLDSIYTANLQTATHWQASLPIKTLVAAKKDTAVKKIDSAAINKHIEMQRRLRQLNAGTR